MKDIHDYEERLKRELEALQASKISENNKQTILRFYTDCRLQRIGIPRLQKLVEVTRTLAAQLNKKREEIEAKKQKLNDESYDTHIKQLLEKYRHEHESGAKIIVYNTEKKRFKIRYPDGKEDFLYWRIYKNQIRLKHDGVVHHIDYDQLNDELYNLTALKKKDHNMEYGRFKHNKLKKGNWLLGYKELKRQLGMKDEDFPEHIQKYYREHYRK